MAAGLVERVLLGEVRAAAQGLTLIEKRSPLARRLLKKLYAHTGKAHIVGVTGAPGTGKSSLIDTMTAELRRRRKKVGVLAVDPTSPVSGGALLGDRLRMRAHFLDPEVFIRSFATRGVTGGLAAAVRAAAHVLDAMGKEIILIETIGVGQDEIEIATVAHTVLAVFGPEMGDEIQVMKAGVREVADILVVNKEDLPGAEKIFSWLQEVEDGQGPVVLKVSALQHTGIPALIDAVAAHRHKLEASGKYERRIFDLCRQELRSLMREIISPGDLAKVDTQTFDRLVAKVASRKLDPYSAAQQLALAVAD